MFKFIGRKKRKRQAELKQLAQKLDLSFEEKEQFSSLKLLSDFRLFKIGHSRKITNILSQKTNDNEESIQLFDYLYVIQSGNTPIIFQQTVLFINSKQLDLPHFRLSPKSKFRKWAERIKLIRPKETPITNDRFDEQFHIKSKEQERVAQSVNQKLLYILNHQGNISVEGINYYLVVYKNKKLLKAQEAQQLYNIGLAIYKELKNKTLD